MAYNELEFIVSRIKDSSVNPQEALYRVYWYYYNLVDLPTKLYYTEHKSQINDFGLYCIKYNRPFRLPCREELNEDAYNSICYIGIKKVVNYEIIDIDGDPEFEYFGLKSKNLIESSEQINEYGELICNIKPAKR
jgi:hypothetical protein